MLKIYTHPEEETRGSRGCFWVAECTLDDGRKFSARSQAGAPNELARQMVEAGVSDQPMQSYDQRGLAALYYRSFHAAAKWTCTEGNRTLQRVRYTSPEEIAANISGKAKNRGESEAAE